MPNIKFSCIDVPSVQKLSGELSGKLSKAIDCPIDWITFSMGTIGEGQLFCDGKILNDTVFVHVEWFDRGEEVKNAVAKIITDALLGTKKFKSSEIETVNVIFVNMEKFDYYENGEHF